jgi:hypothetical protein
MEKKPQLSLLEIVRDVNREIYPGDNFSPFFDRWSNRQRGSDRPDLHPHLECEGDQNGSTQPITALLTGGSISGLC